MTTAPEFAQSCLDAGVFVCENKTYCGHIFLHAIGEPYICCPCKLKRAAIALAESAAPPAAEAGDGPHHTVNCESCGGNGFIREPDNTTRKCLDCTGTGEVTEIAPIPCDLFVEPISPGDKVIRIRAKHDEWQDLRIEVCRDDVSISVAEWCADELCRRWNLAETGGGA